MRKYLLVLAGVGLICRAALPQDVDLMKVAKETTQSRKDTKSMDVVSWVPTEFIESLMKAKPSMFPDRERQFLQMLDGYTIFFMIESRFDTFGNMSGTPKSELETKVSLIIGETTLTPLKDVDLSNDLRSFLQMMKPMFANMLGQVGQSMAFIVFKGKDTNGQRYVTAKAKGAFTVKLDQREFTWRLPLVCFLPAKVDPKTKEEFPGNYVYNPFTGDRLTTEAPNKELKATDKPTP